MSFINDLLNNIPRDIDYPFTRGQLIIFVSIIILQIIICSVVYIIATKKIRKAKTSTQGVIAFSYALLGIFIFPIGGLLSYLYRLLIDTEKSIFFGNTNIFIVIGTGIFAVSYSLYVREVVNLSKAVTNMFKIVSFFALILASIVASIMLIHFVYPLNDTLINFIFMFAAAILSMVLVMGIIFALIDFFRISNKLTKVRLGMSILSGMSLMLQLASMAIYYYLVEAKGSPLQTLIPYVVIIIYGLCFITSLALYYGFFIPIKLQEWTGILPPSFKLLRKKQKLAKKKGQSKT